MLVGPARVAGALVVAALILLSAPAARAQTGGGVFPITGHTLTDEHGFLSFWQAHDGARLLGAPVTQPLPLEGGGAAQYFERGRLELVVDPSSGAAAVRTGNVAAEYVQELSRVFPPMPPRRPVAGELVFEETGHSLREPFLSFWNAAGGVEFFGRPISEPLWELTPRGQRKVQYFERARLERDPSMAGTPDEIQVADLGRALALMRGLDTAPVPNPGFESLGPALPPAPNVAPLGAPQPASGAAPATQQAPDSQPAQQPPAAEPTPAPRAAARSTTASGKSILVNLTDQWLYAYEDGKLVFDAPVATGRDGMETPTGSYRIYAKLPIQTMDGVTNGEYWRVPNVPHVMYFNGDVALHGTYWHNLFGTGRRPSHGCVNLPLDAAKWLYAWAPVGTPVRVTY
nr:MAG: murein L,D-transpeptidase [Chloroflexota bacterium]